MEHSILSFCRWMVGRPADGRFHDKSRAGSAARRVAVESLEGRSLLAAASVTVVAEVLHQDLATTAPLAAGASTANTELPARTDAPPAPTQGLPAPLAAAATAPAAAADGSPANVTVPPQPAGTYATTATTSATTTRPINGIVIAARHDATLAIPKLRAMGANAVRLWYTIGTWSSRWTTATTWKTAATYKKAGFNVTVAFVAKAEPTYAQSKAFFQWAVNQPGAKTNIDRWEIGNEPNLKMFYSGTIKGYVQNYLKGAWDALRMTGETVVGGGMSYNPLAVRESVSYGYNNYCHIANFHHYGGTANEMLRVWGQVKQIFGNKPLTCTEFGVKNYSYSNMTDVARMINQVRPWFDANVKGVHYFALQTGTITYSYASVFKGTTLQPHQPIHSTVSNWFAARK